MEQSTNPAEFDSAFSPDQEPERIPCVVQGMPGWVLIRPVDWLEEESFLAVGVRHDAAGNVVDVDLAERARWLLPRVLVDWRLAQVVELEVSEKPGAEAEVRRVVQEWPAPQDPRERQETVRRLLDPDAAAGGFTPKFGAWLYGEALRVCRLRVEDQERPEKP
jgi:hypothetical protein